MKSLKFWTRLALVPVLALAASVAAAQDAPDPVGNWDVVVDMGLGRATTLDGDAIGRLYGSLGMAPAESQEQLGPLADAAFFDAAHRNSVVACITAARENASFLLITIDTPGGLVSSLQQITTAITNSPVPVIGYVDPPGAQATSAGAFILLATDVAAMAPGTRVGAAHPVALGGGQPDEESARKAGACAYLPKPFEEADLLDAISAALR